MHFSERKFPRPVDPTELAFLERLAVLEPVRMQRYASSLSRLTVFDKPFPLDETTVFVEEMEAHQRYKKIVVDGYFAKSAEGILLGLILFGTENQLVELEMYDAAGESETPVSFPVLETLHKRP